MNEIFRELGEFQYPEAPPLPDDFAPRVIRIAAHERERRQLGRRVSFGAAAAILMLIALGPVMWPKAPERQASREHATPIVIAEAPAITTAELARMDEPASPSQDDLYNYLLPEARDDVEFDSYYVAQTRSVDYTGW